VVSPELFVSVLYLPNSYLSSAALVSADEPESCIGCAIVLSFGSFPYVICWSCGFAQGYCSTLLRAIDCFPGGKRKLRTLTGVSGLPPLSVLH
jgi:hypothetical protein